MLEFGVHSERTIERFWSNVKKDVLIDSACGPCWIWTGYTSGDNYGAMQVSGRQRSAHRLSWEIHYGPIQDGMCVCHECDVSICVNPDHLFLGTPADNSLDRTIKGRSATGDHNGSKTHPERMTRKLTTDQVLEIRRLYDTGCLSHRKLAKRFNVGHAAIRKIVTGRTWKHV